MRTKMWQAFMELTGRPGRNIIIALCVFILTLFCGLSTFFSSSIECFYQTFADMAGYCVVVESERYSTLQDWCEAFAFADSSRDVTGYNNAYTEELLCDAMDFSDVPYGEKQKDYETGKVFVSGNINTECNEYFRNDIFRLSDGKYPGQYAEGIMIPENVASENDIKVGDSISLCNEENTVTAKVVGLYEVNSIPKREVVEGYFEEYPNSIIFVDYESYVKLKGGSNCYAVYFYSTDYKHTAQLYEDMKKLFKDVPDSAVINKILNEELQMTDVISTFKQMTGVTISIMYIVCVVVMSLHTLLWLRGHAKMMAIYNTLGQKQTHIMQILLYEMLMITIPPLFAAGTFIAIVINKFSMQIFQFIVNFCEVMEAEKTFSESRWSFSMDVPQLISRIGILELVVIIIVMIGSFIYVRKPVRQLRNMFFD